MTLSFSLATPAYALHVSDRLVSRNRRPVDTVANKSIVLRATDGLVALGYSGPAALDGRPTDSWIASAVSGDSAPMDAALSFGVFPVRDVGFSLRLLVERLGNEAQFSQRGGQVTAVGWQWREKRRRVWFRHVLWTIRSRQGRLELAQLVPRRLLDRKAAYRVFPTGDISEFTREEWREIVDEAGAAGRDWEKAENVLVDAVRLASDRNRESTIGPHCISIRLRPQADPSATIRFLPRTEHVLKGGEANVPVAFTPWMVAPDAVIAPSVLVGGLTSMDGLLSYAMESPPIPDDQSLKALLRSQERPAL